MWRPSDGRHSTPAFLPLGCLHLCASQASQAQHIISARPRPPISCSPNKPVSLLQAFIYEDGLIIFPVIQPWKITHLWLFLLISANLIRLLHTVKFIFAAFLKPNPFHLQCQVLFWVFIFHFHFNDYDCFLTASMRRLRAWTLPTFCAGLSSCSPIYLLETLQNIFYILFLLVSSSIKWRWCYFVFIGLWGLIETI